MREMSFRFALALLGLVLAVIMIPSLLWGSQVQPLFLAAWALTVLVLMARGYRWEDLMKGASQACQKAFSPILFLLCAGAMIGTWNACGTIPLLTLAGISWGSSAIILPLAFAGCLIFSLLTGTVFGVCGTVGVMFLTVGKSLGIEEAWSVAAVATGAFFGYGLSPLADCTNLASSSARVPLFACIRCQIPVVWPVLAVLLAVFSWAGWNFSSAGENFPVQIELAGEIQAAFRLGIWPVLPPVLVVVLLLLKKPAMLSILAGAGAGALVHCLYQGKSLGETIAVLWQGPDGSGQGEAVQQFFGGGGMTSMSGTVILFLLAFGLFGLLEECGAVQRVMNRLLAAVRTPWQGAVLTALMGFGLNVICASAMCSFIFTLSCLMPVYEKHGWDRFLLVRASFVGCLYLSFWVPWHSNIMTASSLLGVESSLLQGQLMLPAAAVGVLFLAFTVFPSRKKKGGSR